MRKKLRRIFITIIAIWLFLVIGSIITGNTLSFRDMMSLLLAITIMVFIIVAIYAHLRDPEVIKRNEETRRRRQKEEEFRKRERIRAEEWHRAKREYEEEDDDYNNEDYDDENNVSFKTRKGKYVSFKANNKKREYDDKDNPFGDNHF